MKLTSSRAHSQLAAALLTIVATLASPAPAQDTVSVSELNKVLTSTAGAAERAVRIRGVAVHVVPRRNVFYVQDGNSGVAVTAREGMTFPKLGDQVEVDANTKYLGETIDTTITAEAVRVIGSGTLQPARASLADVLAGKHNRAAVEVEAAVAAATSKDGVWQLLLVDSANTAVGQVFTVPPGWSGENLVGNRIRFRGTVGGAGYTALRCSTPEEITIAGSASLAEMGQITEARQLINGGLDLARRGRPARIRGVCTYPNSRKSHFYVQDATGGVLVNLFDPQQCPAFGEEVEIIGSTYSGPETAGINGFTVKRIGAGSLPNPERVPVSEAGLPRFAQWVEVEGVVLQARASDRGNVQLQIAGDNGWCSVAIGGAVQMPADAWSGARVRCRGLNAGFPRLSIFCADPSLVTIVRPGTKNPYSAPDALIATLVGMRRDSADRVRVEGTVLDVKDGWVYLRDGKAALRADLLGGFTPDASWSIPLTPDLPAALPQPGQVVEIVGSPMTTGPRAELRFGQLRVVRNGEMPEPQFATIPQAASGAVASNLVTVRGRLRAYFSGDYASGDGPSRWREVLRLEQDGTELEVAYENANNHGALANFKVDDQIEATGILRPEAGTPPFRLRIRSLSDLRSMGEAPEVGRSRQLRIIAGVGAALLAAGVWITLLRSKLKRERLLAAERSRSDAAMRELNFSLESRVGQRTAELQQTQEELRRALAAEREVGELKSRFVSLVSHEFRTPLGITMSAVELLRGYMDRLPEAKRAELLNDIHEATLRMSSMMEQVLLLGRVEAGKLPYHAVPIDVQELGEKLADEMRSATSAKCPIQFTLETKMDGAKGDEGLMRHVFTNLLSNAVKYSPSGKLVEFKARREGDDAVFTIRDYGIGIPPADQQRLFEAFHRAANVGETPGTGLGLLIVKRCMELHHGVLTFESRENEGTTFTIRLPLFRSER